jgi:SAM-dependent methyltransferase
MSDDADGDHERADTPGPGPSTRSPAAVRATYDRIAESFARTRDRPWPAVAAFLDGRVAGVAADVGCGNGRHLEVLADRADRAVGVDLSGRLLALARERVPGADCLQASADRLPLASASVDLGVYVAAVHHLPTRERRVASLDELARVLAPGGRALVSAWSTTHDRFDPEEGFDTTVDWTLPDGETVPRFYHVYDPEEFRRDVRTSDCVLHRAFTERGNCYGVVGP